MYRVIPKQGFNNSAEHYANHKDWKSLNLFSELEKSVHYSIFIKYK